MKIILTWIEFYELAKQGIEKSYPNLIYDLNKPEFGKDSTDGERSVAEMPDFVKFEIKDNK